MLKKIDAVRRVAICAVVMLLVCGYSLSGAPSSTGKGKNLVFGLSAEPTNLDPALAQGTAKRIVNGAIYRALFSYDKEGELVEELGSYTVAKDNKTYTIKLKDAKFHNGDPVTAEDVKFTFERLLDPKTGATFFKELSVIDKIEIVDTKTVRFILKKECAPFVTTWR
jgi:glutathione transport system substrate-binding protein